MAWAVSQRLPSREKLTLLMLANYAGMDGVCWPSMSRLADECGMSRDSITRAIAELEARELLIVKRRRDGDVSLTNVFHLQMRGVPAHSGEVAAHSDHPTRTQRGGVPAGCGTNLSSEPIKEPEDLKPLAPSASRATPDALPVPAEPAVIDLPTCRKGEAYGVTAAEVRQFAELYPGVDVMAELRAMKGWLLTAPTSERKTAGGMPRFINTWLRKEQNRNQGAKHATHRQHQRTGRSGRLSAAEQIEAARIEAGVDQRFDLIG